MDKLIRFLGIIDWLVAIGSIAVGLALRNWWIVASGTLGLGVAYYQPARIIKDKLEKYLVRKPKPGEVSTALVQNDEAFYAQVLGEQQEAAASPQVVVPRTYGSPVSGYAGTFIGRRKHNQLRVELLNLHNQTVGATRY
jgi:hypothetical protein